MPKATKKVGEAPKAEPSSERTKPPPDGGVQNPDLAEQDAKAEINNANQ